jgi:RsiW-degrading membrane proteinase PrsW (M82 family)
MNTALKWYYSSNGNSIGPFDSAAIRQMIQAGIISSEERLIRESGEDWIAASDFLSLEVVATPETPANGATAILSNISDRVSRASGLEKLENFSTRGLFSQVFGKHSPEEIEDHFTAGTRTTTPELSGIQAVWPAPWAFFRILAASVVLAIGFYWAFQRFENPKLLPGWLFVGCFGIPISVLVFFFEANILRNVSFYRVIYLFVMGGLFSIILSLFLFEITNLSSWLGAMSAGIIEESGKLLAVIFLTRHWKHYFWILNGMLFGAAIGAGFAAFETAGYVMFSRQAEETMVLRGFLAPFAHTIWTAAAAGALWRVKGDEAFQWKMLADVRFLRVFGIVVALHFLWNSPIAIPLIGGFAGKTIFLLVLGLIGWLVVLMLVQAGIKQVAKTQAGEVFP